jgi:hypothetical protein
MKAVKELLETGLKIKVMQYQVLIFRLVLNGNGFVCPDFH